MLLGLLPGLDYTREETERERESDRERKRERESEESSRPEAESLVTVSVSGRRERERERDVERLGSRVILARGQTVGYGNSQTLDEGGPASFSPPRQP